MPSITSWTRLEPCVRDASMASSLEARVHDALWLLARQWQFGEYQGENVGSPVRVELEAEISRLSRYLAGRPDTTSTLLSEDYDSSDLPLEALVEREPLSLATSVNYRLAAEAGLQFFRMLGPSLANKYRARYLEVKQYAMDQPAEEEQHKLDSGSARFISVMAGRVPDGIKLYAELNAALRPSAGGAGLPATVQIDPVDIQDVTRRAAAWLEWCDARFGNAKSQQPWIAERMEYEFAVSAPLKASPTGEVVLTAPEYQGRHLDWYSFAVATNGGLGAAGQSTQRMTRTVLPAPVHFRGMPAARFWEFEDVTIDFGSIEAAPEDLARLLLVEFTLIYGNDFFIIPIDLEVGSICHIPSLQVTNTFGEVTAIKPSSAVDGAGAPWRMFGLSADGRSGASTGSPDLLFIPPVIGSSLEGTTLEEVLFVRDEMANMVWAVERLVESRAGWPLNRHEASQESRQRQEGGQELAEPGPAPAPREQPVYRLSSSVPEYWIPITPVHLPQGGGRAIGLELRPLIQPKGRILMPSSQQQLILNEEEVPRAGARVTRGYRYARWIDGSTHLWIGRQKRPGRAEGSSGLRFDIIEPYLGAHTER